MGKKVIQIRYAILLIVFFLYGCSSSSQAISMTFTPSPILATATPTETQQPTVTQIESPTPSLIGTIVLQIDTYGNSIPWLPLDTTKRPSVEYIGFNTLKYPFNYVLVRQAFAYAIDRRVVAEMAIQYGTSNAVPATTLVPPETLGHDLYNEVGIIFDPQKARELLTQAGYKNPASFPPISFFVNISGGKFSDKRSNMAKTMADMWQTYLGVTVSVYTFGSDYYDQIETNPPDLFWIDFEANYNDPDNFLKGLFYTGSEYNYGGFSNSEFDNIVNIAAMSTSPADRQEIYIRAERLLCETEAALIPLYHSTHNSPE